MDSFYIGLMSGTSLDGADGVLARMDGLGQLQVKAHAFVAFDAPFQATLLALNQSGEDELHRSALAGNQIARHYAAVVHSLLEQTGLKASQITAIGAHGQTVRHQPGLFDGTGYTTQINNPSLLAELTGIAAETGSLEKGKRADVLVLSKRLEVKHTIIGGAEVGR